jgi:hypothetical protein
MLILFAFIFTSFVSNGICYQQCFAKPLQKNPDADARFSVIINLRQTTGAEECKEILPSGIMALTAIDWAVSRLNNVTLVPGVKFGKMLNTCNRLFLFCSYLFLEISK